MIKLLAIAASGGLHVSVLIALMAADVDDLPDGRDTAVRLVVAVPVATPEAMDDAFATDPTLPVEPGLTQQLAAAAPMAGDVPPNALASLEAVAPSVPAPPADNAPSKTLPGPEADEPSVLAPMLTPVRGPAPTPATLPASAVANVASAVPATAPSTAPAAGRDEMPATGGPNGIRAQSTQVALLASVPPEYPVDARRAGQEGRVLVKAFVDIAGSVERTVIEVSSGFAALDTAAAAAVSSYRFRPEVRNGIAVASTILVPIRFSLTGSSR